MYFELLERLNKLNSRLDSYYEAEKKILEGAQSYQIGTRQLTRANLKEIKENIVDLEKEVQIVKSQQAGNGRNKTIGVIPRDI